MDSIHAVLNRSALYQAVELFAEVDGRRDVNRYEAAFPGFHRALKQGLEEACRAEHFTVSLVEGPASQSGVWYALVRPSDVEFEA